MLRVNFPKNIQFIFFSLLLLLTVNFAFRVTLFLLYRDLAADATTADILYCLFNVGFLFDLYISLIILVLPYLLTSIPFLKNKDNKKIYTISNRIILLLGIVNIAISSTDLGFFRYYNSRVTQTVFDWTNDLGRQYLPALFYNLSGCIGDLCIPANEDLQKNGGKGGKAFQYENKTAGFLCFSDPDLFRYPRIV